MNPIHLAAQAASLAGGAMAHAQAAVAPHANLAGLEGAGEAVAPFVFLFAIFLMACFVGYYVIWNVTPALHSPLMALTNGISSVIIVGAMLATGLAASGWAVGFGFLAVTLASVNIFGGFLVTYRMLAMFKSKKKA